MPRRRTLLWLLLSCCACAIGACGAEEPAASHAADGHTHADGHAHDHAHDDAHGHAHDVPPEDVPIVRYEETSDAGPRGGLLVRLSSLEDPDFGWAEVKFHGGKSAHFELWLATDRALKHPLNLDLAKEGTRVLLRFARMDSGAGALGLEAGDPARKGPTNHFVSPRDTGWLPGKADFGRLVRVYVEMVTLGRNEMGRKVLVSDDFELRPPSHDDESK